MKKGSVRRWMPECEFEYLVDESTPKKPTRSPAEWAKEALQVQDACNLSGVVHSFARILGEMVESGMDTDTYNRHPVSILFARKISSLTGAYADDDVNKAWDTCEDMVRQQ